MKMAEKMVTIGSYSTPYEAHMVKSQLESAGIPVSIADEYINLLYSNVFGGVKIQVPETRVSDAQELLASLVRSK